MNILRRQIDHLQQRHGEELADAQHRFMTLERSSTETIAGLRSRLNKSRPSQTLVSSLGDHNLMLQKEVEQRDTELRRLRADVQK